MDKGSDNIMASKTFKKGQQVFYSEFPAGIYTVHTGELEGMYTIRTSGGFACIDGADIRVTKKDAA